MRASLHRLSPSLLVLSLVVSLGCDGGPAQTRTEAARQPGAGSSPRGDRSAAAADPAPAAQVPATVEEALEVLANDGGDDIPLKTVIGGNNDRPQMGIFALTPEAAAEVDAKMGDLKAAYDHAQKVATRSWAGDRTFCEDAVRQIIGYYAVDGMIDDEKRATWKTASFEDLKAKHFTAILERHEMMYDKNEPEVCARTLETFVEALRFVTTEDLEVRNFGF
jgi:hypothetical protein